MGVNYMKCGENEEVTKLKFIRRFIKCLTKAINLHLKILQNFKKKKKMLKLNIQNT